MNEEDDLVVPIEILHYLQGGAFIAPCKCESCVARRTYVAPARPGSTMYAPVLLSTSCTSHGSKKTHCHMNPCATIQQSIEK